jgi:hypothetical protein
MAPRFRFRGELSMLDIDAAIAQHPTLRTYVDRLANLSTASGRPLGQRRARRAISVLLLRTLHHLGTDYTERFDANIERVARLRDELQNRYERVLELFRPGAPRLHSLPPELAPQSINSLFAELERALDDLESQSSRQGLQDAMSHVDHSVVLHEIAEAEAGADVEAAPAPDLGLDPLGSPRRRDPSDPDERYREPPDRAALAHYRELQRLQPPDERLRAEVTLDAERWAKHALPPDANITVYVIPDYSEGNLAAMARFRGLDPNFSGRGYEVQIEVQGQTFRPDGIRFVDPDGRRYQFLEHKEPYTWTRDAHYATPRGREELVAMLRKHAAIAHDLRSRGCAGWRYATGHPDLDRIILEAIDELHLQGVPGADMLVIGEH